MIKIIITSAIKLNYLKTIKKNKESLATATPQIIFVVIKEWLQKCKKENIRKAENVHT